MRFNLKELRVNMKSLDVDKSDAPDDITHKMLKNLGGIEARDKLLFKNVMSGLRERI